MYLGVCVCVCARARVEPGVQLGQHMLQHGSGGRQRANVGSPRRASAGLSEFPLARAARKADRRAAGAARVRSDGALCIAGRNAGDSLCPPLCPPAQGLADNKDHPRAASGAHNNMRPVPRALVARGCWDAERGKRARWSGACLCAGATRLPNREPAFGERRPVTVAPPTCSAASPHRRDGDGRWAPPSPQPEADCSTRRAILASDTVPGGKSSVQERNVGQRRRVVSPRLALASLSPTGVLSMVHVHYCSCSSS